MAFSGWHFTGKTPLGQRVNRFCGIQAVQETFCHQVLAQCGVCALATFILPHLKHLVDSFSCLCRCLKVKKAPALCPEPPLAFIHAAVLGAVDLDREKRQRSELSQGLQRQLEEHSSKADHLTVGKGPVWLERLFAYPEGMEAVWKESTERSSEKAFESLSSPETMSPLLDTFLTDVWPPHSQNPIEMWSPAFLTYTPGSYKVFPTT